MIILSQAHPTDSSLLGGPVTTEHELLALLETVSTATELGGQTRSLLRHEHNQSRTLRVKPEC